MATNLPPFLYHSELVRLTKKGPINIKVLAEPKNSSRPDKPPSVMVQLPDGSKRPFTLDDDNAVEYFSNQVGRYLLTKAEGSTKDGTAVLNWFPPEDERPADPPPRQDPPRGTKPPTTAQTTRPPAGAPAGQPATPATTPPKGSGEPARAPISQTRPPERQPESQAEKLRRIKGHALRIKNALKLAIAAVHGAKEEAEHELPGFLMSERERHGLISTVAINFLNNNVPDALPWTYMSVRPKHAPPPPPQAGAPAEPSDNDGAGPDDEPAGGQEGA